MKSVARKLFFLVTAGWWLGTGCAHVNHPAPVAQASQRTGIPVSNIVVCATHSHTAPPFEGPLREYSHGLAEQKFARDSHEEIDNPARLVERVVKMLAAAQTNLRPAELQAGVATQQGISFNCRYWMKNGKVVAAAVKLLVSLKVE
jgi:hypothetical protein